MLSEQSKEKLYNILHKLLFKYNLLCIINTLELPLYKFIPQDYIRNQLDKSLYLQIVCMKAMHNNEEVIYCFNRRQNYLTISLLKSQHKTNLNNGQQNFGVFLKSMCGPFTVFKEWKGEFKSLSPGMQFLKKKNQKKTFTYSYYTTFRVISLIIPFKRFRTGRPQSSSDAPRSDWGGIAVETGVLFVFVLSVS